MVETRSAHRRNQLEAVDAAVVPELLSAFDEHAEVLADQPPRGHARGVRRPLPIKVASGRNPLWVICKRSLRAC